MRADASRVARALDAMLEHGLRNLGPGARIDVETGTSGARGVVTVRESGPRLSPDPGDVFEPFPVEATPPHDPHVRLALATARQYARTLGGDLQVTSGTGEVVFRLELPLGPSDTPPGRR